MKTKAELHRDIAHVTNRIYEKFPELSKYIKEMPESNLEPDQIDITNLEEYYNSLDILVKNYAKTHKEFAATNIDETSLYPGYPKYQPSDDIYNQGKEERDINPEDITKQKAPNESTGALNEKPFRDDMSGGDLDVPGSELDDQQESVGSEDEENNYYSLGGDNHNDLEEDKA